jgi:hypothetical protein
MSKYIHRKCAKTKSQGVFTQIELQSSVRNYANVVRLLVSGVSSIDLIRTQETGNKKTEILCNAVVGQIKPLNKKTIVS